MVDPAVDQGVPLLEEQVPRSALRSRNVHALLFLLSGLAVLVAVAPYTFGGTGHVAIDMAWQQMPLARLQQFLQPPWLPGRERQRQFRLDQHRPIKRSDFQLPTRTLARPPLALPMFSSSKPKSLDKTQYDLAVVGAGPVGVSGALRAAEQGKKVVLIDAPLVSASLMVDDEDLSFGAPSGLFSKALRDTAKQVKVNVLRDMGLDDVAIWQQVRISCAKLAKSNAKASLVGITSAGVTYVSGFAKLINKGKSLRVTLTDGGTQVLSPSNVLLAAGSEPFRPGNIPFDGDRILDSDSINMLSFLPRSIAITGSGIISIEYAKIFAKLGTSVTLIIRDQYPTRALEKIGLDKDIAATLVSDLIRSGITIEREAQASTFDVQERPAPITIELTTPKGDPRPEGRASSIQVDAYLAAVGRKPNVKDLGVEDAGVEVDEYGNVVVGPDLRTTSQANIYAAGDIVGRPFLASTGAAQSVAAVNSMFGSDQDLGTSLGSAGAAWDPASLAKNPFAFPVGLWSTPEVAYYGLSKQQAREAGYDAAEGIALYNQCLRGVVFNPEGLLKLVFENTTGRVLGVHIVGDDACELIHYGMELVRAKRTLSSILEGMYSAVTFHELYQVAARAGRDPKGGRARRQAALKNQRERTSEQNAKRNRWKKK